ncbi:hypothetical protein BaRGS_00005113, partial [Batillaria attramentaria]
MKGEKLSYFRRCRRQADQGEPSDSEVFASDGRYGMMCRERLPEVHDDGVRKGQREQGKR